MSVFCVLRGRLQLACLHILFRRSFHSFPKRAPPAAGDGDPAGTYCLHGGGTPVLPPPSAGSLFADQHRSRCCAGSGYAPDLVSAGSAPAAAAYSRAAKWQHRCGGVSHAGVANAVVLGVVLQQLFRCDIHCHHLLSGRTHHFRSGAAVSGTANSGRCHRQSIDSVPRRAANRHYDRHCDSGVVADLVRAEPAAVRQIPHAVWGGVHLGAHGNPHPPAVSSAGQRHYFPRPAAESADEDIRHGIPPHSLPRLRQPAGYAAGADSAGSEKKLTGTAGKAARGAGHGAPETSCTLQYPVFLVLCVAAGDRALCDSAGTVYPAVAAAESGGDHSVLFRDADYSAGVAAVYPHCGDVHRIGHHGRPAFADAFLQLVHVPHHYGEPRPHCPHGPDADTRTEDVRRLSSVYHL